MASAKRAKSTSKKAKLSKVLPKAARVAKQATQAIERSVQGVTEKAKKVAAGARKGVAKRATAVVEQVTVAKKRVAKKAQVVAKKAKHVAETAEKRAKSVAETAEKKAKGVAKKPKLAKGTVGDKAKTVAKKARATIAKQANLVKQAARGKAKAVKEEAQSKTKKGAGGSNGAIGVGSLAPAFSLPDQDGNIVTSESLKGSPYVLYFYPKDDTPGCTKEACGFRDARAAFAKNGVKVLGVSPDSQASHARFAKKYGLPFTLLSDVDKTLATAYGVWVEKTNYGRKYMGIERSTFLVDAEGRLQKIWRGVKVPGHVDDVLLASSAL